jgi:hypothetical protein
LAKSSPVAPCVDTDTLPKVAAVLKVMGTTIAELVLPVFTDPKLVPVSGLAGMTVKFCVTVGAAA